MNTLATRTGGTGLISREDLAKSLNNAAMSMPSVGGDKAFLKMDKNNGDWLFGQEETVVEDDSLWAANPLSLKHGWVAWDTNAGGAPVQEIMVPISRDLPAINSLPPLPMSSPDRKGSTYQLEYQAQRSVDFACVKGEDEGTQVEYKQSSTGAMKLFGALTNAMLDQVQKGDEIVAVGKLTSASYKHKKYGNIINPVFDIVEWRAMDDAAPVADKPAETAAPPEDTSRRRVRPATAPTEASLTAAAAGAASAPETETAEETELAREYAATQAEAAVPRRRVRR